jgi:hypothetical protein
MLRIRSVAGLIIMLLFLLGAIPASAQSAGTILGVVKDASGAVVSEATVTIANIETGLSRTVPSGADGAFRAPALPVGRYDLRIEKTGFNAEVQRGLILEVGQELVVNASLQIGAVTQEVLVSGEAPLVNTTSSALGSMVNEQKMSDLPLNGRNYVDLTLIQAGVSPNILPASGGSAGSSGSWFSANGAPPRSNNFTLDGAIMQNGSGATTGSESGTTLGVDGIREYKIVTSAFSAEYGLTMGSQMIIVSKGGSNNWHGDAFEYLRNSALDARNFFDSSATSGGKRLPEFQRNNYGGSFGGPIKKDKTFFYAVYEGLRQNLGVTVLDNVLPTACHQLLNPGGNTTLANPTACASTLTSSTIIPKVVQPFIDLYPLPNLPGNQFTFPTASTQSERYAQMRVDHNFSPADTVFGRYTIDDGEIENGTPNIRVTASGNAFPWLRTVGTSRNQFVTLSENHIFSPTLLNLARVSFSRTNLQNHGTSPLDLLNPKYQQVPGQPMGQVSVGSGVTQLTQLGPTNLTLQNLYTLSEDVYATKGHHGLKFGVLFNQFQLPTITTKLSGGQVTFADLASFMQGIFDNYSALTPGSLTNRFWSYKTLGLYAQDDIRVNSRLTLNAGMRYEFTTVPSDRYGLESRFLNFANPTQSWTYGPIMRNPSLKNFSPRVGFAWDVTGKGKTAIRSGFGLYQEPGTFATAFNMQSFAMPPYSSQSSVVSNPSRSVLSLPLTFGPGDQANRLQSMDYNLTQPRSLQYNFTVEQQMPFGTALAISYVGYRGMHLWQVSEGNPFRPTDIVNGSLAWFPFLCGGVASATTCTGAVANPAYQRVNPAYASYIKIGTGGDSSYNSLQVVLNKRLSHGLELQGTYTWSKSLDDTQGQSYFADCFDTAGLEGLSPLNSRLDKGPSCWDLTHNFHVNALYHVPDMRSNKFGAKLLRGWWVGGIMTAHTGFPFTPLVNLGRSNNGVFSGQGATGIVDRVSVGTDTTSTTFRCTGTGSAFPGAPPCSNGSVTYQYVPYDPGKVITGDPNMWLNPLMFRLPPAGFLGNVSRGMLRGPGLANLDASINKDTALPFLGENARLQFRAEIFNLLNHANFGMPSGRIFTGTLTDPAGASEAPLSNVARIQNTLTSSRQIQLALKIVF